MPKVKQTVDTLFKLCESTKCIDVLSGALELLACVCVMLRKDLGNDMGKLLEPFLAHRKEYISGNAKKIWAYLESASDDCEFQSSSALLARDIGDIAMDSDLPNTNHKLPDINTELPTLRSELSDMKAESPGVKSQPSDIKSPPPGMGFELSKPASGKDWPVVLRSLLIVEEQNSYFQRFIDVCLEIDAMPTSMQTIRDKQLLVKRVEKMLDVIRVGNEARTVVCQFFFALLATNYAMIWPDAKRVLGKIATHWPHCFWKQYRCHAIENVEQMNSAFRLQALKVMCIVTSVPERFPEEFAKDFFDHLQSLNEPRNILKAKSLAYLEIFSKVRCKTSWVSLERQLYGSFLDLLTNRDESVVEAALKCVISWDGSGAARIYESHLFGFVHEKTFREKITEFSISTTQTQIDAGSSESRASHHHSHHIWKAGR